MWKEPPTVLWLLALLILFPTWGYYTAITSTSLNPYDVVAPSLATLVLVAFLLGALLALLGLRFSKRLSTITPLQWLGFGGLLALLSVAAYLLGPSRGMFGWISPVSFALILFSIEAIVMRKKSHSWTRAPTY